MNFSAFTAVAAGRGGQQGFSVAGKLGRGTVTQHWPKGRKSQKTPRDSRPGGFNESCLLSAQTDLCYGEEKKKEKGREGGREGGRKGVKEEFFEGGS